MYINGREARIWKGTVVVNRDIGALNVRLERQT